MLCLLRALCVSVVNPIRYTMFIYIARHAWAGERGDPRWPDDSLRELTPEGIERYTKVVKALAERGFEPAANRHQPLHPLPADGRHHRQARRRQAADRRARSARARLGPGAAHRMDQRARRRRRVLGRPQSRRGGLGRRAHRRRRRPHPLRQGRGRGDRVSTTRSIAGAGELYWLATAKLLGV